MRIQKSAELLFQFLKFISDFAAVYLAYVAAFLTYEEFFGLPPQPWDEIKFLILIPAAFCTFFFSVANVYLCQPGPLELERLKRILSAYFWSQVSVFSLTFFTKSHGYSRLMTLIGFFLGIIFILFARYIIDLFTRPMRKNLALRRTLILGAGKVGKTLAKNLLTIPGQASVVGFLDDQYPYITSIEIRMGEKTTTFPVLGQLSDLTQIAQEYKVNEVIVAMTKATHNLHQELLEKAQDLGIRFSIVPTALELMLTGAQSYSIGHVPLFRIGEKPFFVFTPLVKRSFDIIGALLIALFSAPIWIATVIAIKLDSKGPVLFTHERVGKKGRKFLLHKFRSMQITAQPYAVTPDNQKDPRITKVGKFIRRTSIDELPQLLNVIKGDMSLVGPRPEMPFIVDGYDEFQKIRLLVKPGLTGVWQISADRANPIHENLDYDFYYLKNQSFWLDLAILIKTLTSVARGVGAY
ncbi:MAG: sugar transferase [Oligoflexia bacterium]|nr:sugar transferase [Oligoflexia bacterium]